jgi:hypothetical protein
MVEDKVIKLSKEEIIALEQIIMDTDKDKAYDFLAKIKEKIESNEQSYIYHRKLSKLLK